MHAIGTDNAVFYLFSDKNIKGKKGNCARSDNLNKSEFALLDSFLPFLPKHYSLRLLLVNTLIPFFLAGVQSRKGAKTIMLR
jgi:hypothetical protein